MTGLRSQAVAGYGNDGMINPRRQLGRSRDARVRHHRRRSRDGPADVRQRFQRQALRRHRQLLGWRLPLVQGRDHRRKDRRHPEPRTSSIWQIPARCASINNSWGSGNSLPFNASLPTVLASFNRNYGDFYKPVLDKDVLVVFSAGNGFGVHAGIDAAAPLNDPRLRSNWLSVANYSSFTAADPSTSFCGQTATWCVAGPGSAGRFVGARLYNGPGGHPGPLSARQLRRSVFGDHGHRSANRVGEPVHRRSKRLFGRSRPTGGPATTMKTHGAAKSRRQAAAITLVSGARLGDPDGFTSRSGRAPDLDQQHGAADPGLLGRGFAVRQ